MQPQDGNWADLVVQVVAWCIDLGVVGGMTGIEAFSGRFFPENLLYGPDLCGQVGPLQGLRNGNASISALDSCPGIWSAGVPGRRE